MANDYPQVKDQSTLTGVFQTDSFLGIGIEGEKASDGAAVVAHPVVITSAEQAATEFGVTSSLTQLIQFVLSRGISYVVAVASASNSTPNLTARRAAWVPLEEDVRVRIRLTDSTDSATLVALGLSCDWANNIQHKQFACVGLTGPAVKATSISVSNSINKKRCVLFDPAVRDSNGDLQEGAFAAAYGACEIAKNPDIADSLNLASIGGTTGIETDTASGLPVYRLRANAGTPINDFQDLLDAGVSPFQQGPDGKAQFTHIRTTYTDDDTFDALSTLLIDDALFLGISDLLLNSRYVRLPNTKTNRDAAGAEVDSYLKGQSNFVQPVELPDNTIGFGVTVTPSVDLKTFTVSYTGQIVRGTNVIIINGTLTVPVASGTGS